ncbi:hypothetical protein [Dyella psychrodurans]|uniref:Uncharacterized protein n=1 Tax=Dyella psychrodurans TaxID=1927960 RepID=A0A370XDF8_9GAMM|nr:hypothetical protein [Dyella psychrodurans]RDS86300.1 hypothetical protein DWU99_03300 [Dyella psychrodurans]
MNEIDEGDDESFALPPMVGKIGEGNIEWVSLEAIDFELLGYFLSCHLIIEHYLDSFLKSFYPNLKWKKAKLSFAQKIDLLTTMWVSDDKHDSIPALKHMNSLRNKISHRVNFSLSMDDLQPMVYFLNGISERALHLPTPLRILRVFTTMVCVSFAGNISRRARGVP